MTQPDLAVFPTVVSDTSTERGFLLAETTMPADNALPNDPERLEPTCTIRERRLLEDAQRDICEAHPCLPVERVHVVVECLWAAYDGARVRDFIPVLVRKQAREELRDMDAEPTEIRTSPHMTAGGAKAPFEADTPLPQGCAGVHARHDPYEITVGG